MTVSNVSNTTRGAITQAPGNPGALQRSHSLPSARTAQNDYRRLLPRSDSSPARISQNSPESLRAPVAGKVLFRALEETGASSSKVRHVFDIVESGHEAGEKSYQITMSDGLRDSVTMRLEMPDGENLDLESAQEKIKAGEYKVKIRSNGEGESVCYLVESGGLKIKGGMDIGDDSKDLKRIFRELKETDSDSDDNSDDKISQLYDEISQLYGLTMPSEQPSHSMKELKRKDSDSDDDLTRRLRELKERYSDVVEDTPSALASERTISLPSWWPWRIFRSPSSDDYVKLGNQMFSTERVNIDSDNPYMSKWECYQMALRLAPNKILALENIEYEWDYKSLAEILEPGKIVKVDGKRMTKRDCELKAETLRLNPEYPRNWIELGQFLKSGETVEFGGQQVDRQACYSEAVRLEPDNFLTYVLLSEKLKPGETVQVDGRKMDQRACELESEVVQLNSNKESPTSWAAMAIALKPGETVQIDGRKMDQRACKLKVSELVSNQTKAETVQRRNEAEARKVQRRKDADYCFELGINLQPGKTVQIWGQDITKQRCFLKALELNPKHSDAYNHLGLTLEPGTTVEVNGEHMSQQACYWQALASNPKNDMAYVNLGTTLEPGTKIKVNGKKINQQECFLEALRLNPDNDQAYDNLGNTLLMPEDKVRVGGLISGERLTKWQCYLRAITLNPKSASAYQHLGMTLQEGERVKVFGKYMSKQDCFKKAMELAPSSQNLVHAENYLLQQTSPSPQARKLYDQILKGEKRFDQALMNKELHPAVTNAASLWLMHQMAGTAHSSGSLRPGASEVSKRLYDLYRPGPLLDNLSDEDKYIWQILLQDANNKGLLNRHQTDTIKNTIKINQLEHRVDGLRASALKTLNHALNRLQDNQLKLAQSNVAIARQLQLERKIRFYANCASFALAFVPVAGEALASGARLFSDGMLTSMEEGTQDIGKQNIKETLTHIWNNAEQIPAIAEDTGKFLAGEFPAEYAQYATGINAGQKVIGVLEQTAIDKLSERLEKNLKQTASEIQGNTAGPIHFGSPAAARPSGVQAARPAQPSQNVQNVESDADDSGLDSADEDNNRLAALIKRNRKDKFSKALGKSSIEAINKPVIRTRRTHIRSTPLDIAAHYGREEMADSLEEAGAKSLRHASALKAVEIAEEKAKAREAQNSGGQ